MTLGQNGAPMVACRCGPPSSVVSVPCERTAHHVATGSAASALYCVRAVGPALGGPSALATLQALSALSAPLLSWLCVCAHKSENQGPETLFGHNAV